MNAACGRMRGPRPLVATKAHDFGGRCMNTDDRERLLARFWAKVNKTPTCWLWTGSGTLDGYGQLYVDGRKNYVHRISYEIHVGRVPDGLVLDHLCRVRRCVNPAHLEAVTNRENVLRGAIPSSTVCVNGHERTAGNIDASRGWRECLLCKRNRDTKKNAIRSERRALSRARSGAGR